MSIEELRKAIEEAVKPTEFRSTPNERFGKVMHLIADELEHMQEDLAVTRIAVDAAIKRKAKKVPRN